jgi:hypothetical protein
MAWINHQSFWFWWPDFTTVFVGRQALEGVEAPGEVRGHSAGVERLVPVLRRLVIVFLDCGFFSCTVQARYLPSGPGVIGGRAPVCDGLFVTDAGQAMGEGLCVLVPGGELETVIGQHGREALGHGRDQMTEALGGARFRGAGRQLRIGELRGPVDGHAQAERSVFGPHCGDSAVAVAARVARERLLLGPVSCTLGQPTEAMALPTPLPGRPGPVRKRRLHGGETSVQRP